MSAATDIATVLLGGGAVSTLYSAVVTWVKSRQRKPVTIRITRNDGASVFLDPEAIRSLDADKLKEILAEILPDESEEYLDVDDEDHDEEPPKDRAEPEKGHS